MALLASASEQHTTEARCTERDENIHRPPVPPVNYLFFEASSEHTVLLFEPIDASTTQLHCARQRIMVPPGEPLSDFHERSDTCQVRVLQFLLQDSKFEGL